MKPTTNVIDAVSLLDFEKPIVANAEFLSQRILSALDHAPSVTIRMAGVRGAAPSYYSTILMRVGDRLGLEQSLQRLHFEFDSAAQERAFAQSVGALRKLASSPTEPPR